MIGETLKQYSGNNIKICESRKMKAAGCSMRNVLHDI